MLHPDIETQIRDTLPQLKAWSERMRVGFTPAQGTPLAEDETVFLDLSTANVAWECLGSALDHLKGFGAWFRAYDAQDDPNRPGLHPIATFSVLRGALVGGAIASWVLTSDDVDVRTGRSLTVAAERYKFHLQWLNEVHDHAIDPALHAARVAYVQDRANQVAALRETRKPKGKLYTTTAINEATAEIWPGNADRATQTAASWQAGSGDAHALGWPMLAREHEMTPLGDGTSYFVGAPSLLDVADAYFCAYDFVAYGFHRLDELGT